MRLDTCVLTIIGDRGHSRAVFSPLPMRVQSRQRCRHVGQAHPYARRAQPASGAEGLRVKLAWAGEGGGARPPPFTTFTITSKVAVYAPAEWADTLTLFHLL
jgi:hypothetical protein